MMHSMYICVVIVVSNGIELHYSELVNNDHTRDKKLSQYTQVKPGQFGLQKSGILYAEVVPRAGLTALNFTCCVPLKFYIHVYTMYTG